MILNQPVDQKIILPTNEFVSSSHIYVMQLHFLGFQCKKTLIVQVEPTRPRDNRQHQSQAEQHQSLTLGFSLEIEQQSLCHVGRPRQASMEKMPVYVDFPLGMFLVEQVSVHIVPSTDTSFLFTSELTNYLDFRWYLRCGVVCHTRNVSLYILSYVPDHSLLKTTKLVERSPSLGAQANLFPFPVTDTKPLFCLLDLFNLRRRYFSFTLCIGC